MEGFCRDSHIWNKCITQILFDIIIMQLEAYKVHYYYLQPHHAFTVMLQVMQVAYTHLLLFEQKIPYS